MGRGRARASQTLNYRSTKFLRADDDDGGAGTREPRQPQPTPVSGAGAKPLPKPIIEAKPGRTDA